MKDVKIKKSVRANENFDVTNEKGHASLVEACRKNARRNNDKINIQHANGSI